MVAVLDEYKPQFFVTDNPKLLVFSDAENFIVRQTQFY